MIKSKTTLVYILTQVETLLLYFKILLYYLILCSVIHLQKAVEMLQDLGQNVTARVKTLEGECAKIDVQNTLNSTVTLLKEQVN